jgi:hypothetical protein
MAKEKFQEREEEGDTHLREAILLRHPSSVSGADLLRQSLLGEGPVGLQDLLIQLASSSGLGYVVLLMLQLYSVSPLLPLSPIVALGIIIHFLVLSQKNSELLEKHQDLKELTSRPLASLPTPPSPKPVPSSVEPPQSESDSCQDRQIEWEEEQEEEGDEERIIDTMDYATAVVGLSSIALHHEGHQASNAVESSRGSSSGSPWEEKEDDGDSSLSSFRSIVWESEPSSEEFSELESSFEGSPAVGRGNDVYIDSP